MNENEPLIILPKLCLVMVGMGVSWAILANPLKNLLDRTLFRGEREESAK